MGACMRASVRNVRDSGRCAGKGMLGTIPAAAAPFRNQPAELVLQWTLKAGFLVCGLVWAGGA